MPAQLNDAQREAVRVTSGPLLVLAGAGTGKTRVITYRVGELIRQGVPPEKILAVTFTNKAAREMRQRVKERVGKKAKEGPEISTFHSLCVRILRRHIHLLGYRSTFAIADSRDQEEIARLVLREIRVPDGSLRPRDLLSQISRWKSDGLRPEEAIEAARTDREHLAASAYRRYQSTLRGRSSVDFDDLLLVTIELFKAHSEAREFEAGRLQHILIDEYQDTNSAQYQIVKALAQRHRNLCVVGDDDQSIYGWRGAEVRHILRFRDDWPEAKVVYLRENYRCSGSILEWANRLIHFNNIRYEKSLVPARGRGEAPRIQQYQNEVEEAEGVVNDIQLRLRQPGSRAGDFAILFRTNEQPRPFETALREAKLPYVLIGGMSFFDRKEVKDVLAYMRLLAEPRDEQALLRVINTPPRGVGPSSVKLLLEHAVKRGKPLWDVCAEDDFPAETSANAKRGVAQLQQTVDKLRRSLKHGSPLTVCQQLLKEIGYREEIERLHDQEEDRVARWQTVEEVINALAEYQDSHPRAGLLEFLDNMALSGEETRSKEERKLAADAVVLMTLHSAKGLEFPEVYLVGMEEGFLPHRRSLADSDSAIEEERRLCYVGVTRAQDRLTLSLALTRRKWGKPRDTLPSRFLYEITGQADHPRAVEIRRQAAKTIAGEFPKPQRGKRPTSARPRK